MGNHAETSCETRLSIKCEERRLDHSVHQGTQDNDMRRQGDEKLIMNEPFEEAEKSENRKIRHHVGNEREGDVR